MEIEHLQREFPLLARIEGPAVVPSELLRHARTYREACRFAWELRRVRNMNKRDFAQQTGLTRQHVGDYFNADDKPARRSLPGEAIRVAEDVLGNTFVSQWIAQGARLTVLEEMQASRRVA